MLKVRVCDGQLPLKTLGGPLRPSEVLGGPWKLFGCLGAWKFGGPSEVLGGPCRPPAADHCLFKALEKRGNLGHQPETRKGIKLGACLPEQGVGRINQQATFDLLGRRDVPSPDMPPPPPPPTRVGTPFLHVTSSRRAAGRPEP